jgi:hypothetical protein
MTVVAGYWLCDHYRSVQGVNDHAILLWCIQEAYVTATNLEAFGCSLLTMADADDSSTGLPGASSGLALPQAAPDVSAASFEEASFREDQIKNAVAFLSHPKVRWRAPLAPAAWAHDRVL